MRDRINFRLLVVILGLLDALGPLSIDLYLPGFPELKASLDLNDAAVQFTLAAMTGGLAAGQAGVGAWSDRVGRRGPLLLAAAIYTAASIGCAVSPNLMAMVVFRFLQGVSAGGCAVLVLAIVRDLSSGEAFVTLLSRITLLTTGAPLVAPVLGAMLMPVVGWRGLFFVLSVVAAILTVAVVLVFPESHTHSRGASGSRLRRVLRDRSFLHGLLLGVGTYAGVYTYVACAPLLLRGVYGLSAAAFSGFFFCTTLGLFIGVRVASRMVRRFGTSRVLMLSVSAAVSAALALLIAGPLGLPATLASLWLFVTACGGIFPCAATIALAKQGDQAGTATSAYGFTTFTAAALISPIPGIIGVSGTTPLGATLMGTASLLVLATAFIIVRHRHDISAGRLRPDQVSSAAEDKIP
ncbi:multidrug effflux MFS transporter [Paenarthrobacter nicotinovorans]|uniref:multidrug effflux MFS transporter n=1 Tax=Paenarthrobacter nicotinovorans TaxID=29320 RepID=UPI0037F74F13